MTHEADLKLDAIRKLLDLQELEQPKVDFEWQPMETAPKDGEEVLIILKEMGWCLIVEWVEEEWQEVYTNERISGPTHCPQDWMWSRLPYKAIRKGMLKDD